MRLAILVAPLAYQHSQTSMTGSTTAHSLTYLSTTSPLTLRYQPTYIDTTTTLSANSPLGNNGPLSFPDFAQSSETAQSSEMAQSPEVSCFNPVFPPIWGALSNGHRVMGGILEFIPQDIPEAQSLLVCGFIYTSNYYL